MKMVKTALAGVVLIGIGWFALTSGSDIAEYFNGNDGPGGRPVNVVFKSNWYHAGSASMAWTGGATGTDTSTTPPWTHQVTVQRGQSVTLVVRSGFEPSCEGYVSTIPPSRTWYGSTVRHNNGWRMEYVCTITVHT